jgi:DNA-binding transcriptional regulator YiaG
MSTLAAALRNEITRLSKKTAKQFVTPVRSTVAMQRRHIAALRKQVGELQKELQTLKLAGQRGQQPSSSKPVRFRAQGLKSLRRRLGLGADDLGTLVGVSAQTIYNWEAKKSAPGKDNLAALARVRAYGKRQARAQLSLTDSK